MDGATSVVQMVLSLIAVVGIILGLAWMTRRMQVMRGGAAGSELRVRATLAVGLKERVVLIEVRGEPLLIGVAPGQITLLQTAIAPLAREGEGDAADASPASGPTASGPRMSFSTAFAHQLNQLLRR
ncbi:MAG: flagellar biosynthetic protein FliO [Panacagrimonas sp.]